MVAPQKIMSAVPSKGRMKEETKTFEPANLKARGGKEVLSRARLVVVFGGQERLIAVFLRTQFGCGWRVGVESRCLT